MAVKPKAKRAAKRVAKADAKTRDKLAPYHGTTPVRAIGWVSDIGDQPQLRTLCGAVTALGLLSGNPRMARAGVRMLLSFELATLAKDFIKRRVDRTRPRSAARGETPALKRGRHTSKEQTSFPSGHTAGAISVARAFAREYPQHRAAALAAAGAVAVAQIPRCSHYPSDVGAGIAVGLTAEAVVDRLWPLRRD